MSFRYCGWQIIVEIWCGFFAVVISDLIWGAQRVENNDTIIAVIEPKMQFKTFTWITTFDWYFNLFFWQMKDNENQFAVGDICTGEFLIFLLLFFPYFLVHMQVSCFKFFIIF